MSQLCGIWGRPYIDLSPFIDTACFPALDAEIVYGLAQVEPTYTGGSLSCSGGRSTWTCSSA